MSVNQPNKREGESQQHLPLLKKRSDDNKQGEIDENSEPSFGPKTGKGDWARRKGSDCQNPQHLARPHAGNPRRPFNLDADDISLFGVVRDQVKAATGVAVDFLDQDSIIRQADDAHLAD